MTVALLGSPGRWDALTFLRRFERSRIPIWAWIVVLWALFVFPAIVIRAFHYEEGTVIGLARGAIEDSNWFVPHLYGERFVERPVLMSWLVAALGTLAGGINQWVARIPAIVSLLCGGLLVFSLVRRYASALAALFAAICFLVSPIILQKVVVAEPDVLLSVLLFAAFVVWWNGHEAGGVSLLRWLAIGVILALAGLTKGPQPLAYFGLGIGAFLLLRRQWLALLGLALAGAIAGLVSAGWYWMIYQPGDLATWAQHSRLTGTETIASRLMEIAKFLVTFVLEMLPSMVLAVPLAAIVVRERTARSNDLALALLLYSLCCTVVLMLWPHGIVRYAMPASLALAALAGLAFERFRTERPALVNAALAVVGGLAIYQVVLSWVAMPLWSTAFERSRIAGNTIVATMRERPAVLYVTADALDKNILLYVRPPIRAVSFQDVLALKAPAWVLLTPERTRQLQAAQPQMRIDARPISEKPVLDLVELRAR